MLTAVLTSVVILLLASLHAARRSEAAGQPNIVLVLTDDQTSESFDRKYMPQLNRLVAARGLVFTRYYNTFPLCCPSRASILRGQYAHNTGVNNNGPPEGGYFRFLKNGLHQDHLGLWLSRAGYRTGFFGKFLNGYGVDDNRVIGGWNTWFVGNTIDQPYYHYRVNSNGTDLFFGGGDDNYFTNVVAKRTLSFIRNSSQAGKPFFAFVSPYSPHSPSTPAKIHAGRFAAEPFPIRPNYDEAAIADKPSYIRALPRVSADMQKQIRLNWRKRLEANLSVDDFIGQLFATLQDLGEQNNTYVFVTTDNGFERGEHRIITGKSLPYDESLRTKLFVVGPGIRQGASSAALVANIDLAPTFAELASAVIPSYVDGRSLAPLFTGELGWRNALYATGFPPVTTEGDPTDVTSEQFRSLITRHYIYTIYPKTGESEMYDFRADPFELENIASKAGSEFRSKAEELIRDFRACTAASCREVEDGLLPAPPVSAAGSPLRGRE